MTLSASAQADPIRPRRLRHPGPPLAERLQSRECRRGTHLRVQLMPGLSLQEAVVRPLAASGVRSASLTLLGGGFSALHYCIGPATPEGPSVAAYAPAVAAGPSFLISGQATLGLDLAGQPMVHCHAVLRDSQGRLCGGHLVPQHCIIGDTPVAVRVVAARTAVA